MPSIFFSRISSPMRAWMRALFCLVGDLGDDDLLAFAAPGDFSTSMRARMTMLPRPVRCAGLDAAAAEDEAARREVGARDEAHQVVDRARPGCGRGGPWRR